LPNLIAVWNPKFSEGETETVLARQKEMIDVPAGNYQWYAIHLPMLGMGLLDHGILGNGQQPIISSDGQWVLFLDGEIYNLDDLLQKYCLEESEGDESPPRQCLRLLLSKGDQIVEEFNGLFCVLLYDRGSNTLKAFSDRFAFRPLFYLMRGETFFCASEIKGITAVDSGRKEIDAVGLLGLFSFGSHIMDRTWLEGYRKLPPASVLVVNEKGLTLRKYWDYRYEESEKTLDQATYFTQFRVLLDRAVERCMRGRGRIGLFLSGGYDSRSVAAAIQPHHLPLPSFTFGYERSRDVQYAKLLADRIGLQHYYLYDDGPYLSDYCRKIVWRSEGMVSFYNQTSIRYHSFIKQHADILLLGILGEFSGSHTWPGLLLSRNRAGTIHSIFNRLIRRKPQELKRIFQASFFFSAFDCLQAEFKNSFDAISNEHPCNMADSWQYLYFQHRNTFQAPSVDRYLFEVRGPHMDSDLVKFLLTIPPYARLEQRVYKKMIAYGFPQIRDVPCTNSGKPINPDFAREYLTMVTSYMGRKVFGHLGTLPVKSTDLGREFRDPAEELRKEPQLKELLLDSFLPAGIFPVEIFNQEEIKKMVEEHFEGRANHSDTIFLLISIGIALEYFYYDRPIDKQNLLTAISAEHERGHNETNLSHGSSGIDSRTGKTRI